MEMLNICPACQSTSFEAYIQTRAMMHRSEEKFNFDRCNDCGLVFLNPRVPEDQLSAYYTSHYLPYRGAEAWGKYARLVEGSQKRIDRKRANLVKKWQTLTPVSKILDVGCGKPTFLQALRLEVPCHLFGSDFSEEGWKDHPEDFKGLTLMKGDILSLRDLPPMDVITMWHYLEHDYRPQEHLRHLREFAHPGTTLVIEVPNFDSWTRKKFGPNWAGYHTPRHTGLYSPDNISILLKNSGWEVKKVQPYGTLDPYTLYWMSKMEEKGIDWSASMEPRFAGYVTGMILFAPLFALQKHVSFGFMTVVAHPAR